MRTAAIVLMAAALLAAGSLRARSYAHSRSTATLYLAVAANGAGLAVLLNAPGPYQWFDHEIFHQPNLSALVSHVLTVLGAAAAAEMVTTLIVGNRSDHRRLRLGGAVVIVAAMITTFALAAPGREDAMFFEHYKADSRLTAYWIVFFGSVILQLGYVAVLTLRYTRHDDRWLGRGLRLIGAGSVCGSLFLAARLLDLAAPGMSSAADPVAMTLLGLACVLLAVGVLTPQIGLVADRLLTQRRLRPLWEIVTSEFPHVRAPATRLTLYRSVLEIQDALAEARSHNQVTSPPLIALDALPARPADHFDRTVNDLLSVASRLSSDELAPRSSATR